MEIFSAVTNLNNTQNIAQNKMENVEHNDVLKGELGKDKKDETKRIEEQSKEADKKEVKKELEEVTKQLNEEMSALNTTIRFGFNDKIDEMYVSVIDTKNDKVIRKIPSDEAMKLMAKMRELVGMLFDEKG